MARRDSKGAARPAPLTGPDPVAPWLDRIARTDCVEGLGTMPEGCARFAFADPPYNLQLQGALVRPDQSDVSSVDEGWDRFESLEQYDLFTLNWLHALRRVLHPDGTVAVAASYHNLFRIGAALQDLGYWILNDIVWVKSNPMPNFKGRRFTNAHETVIWAARSRESRYVFNYESLKAGNEDVQLRSDWHFPVCGGRERIKGPDGRKAHPTQKPEALVARLVMAASNPGDLVLDPFMGSGTTAAVAKRLRRRYAGFERDPVHFATATARAASVEPLDEALVAPIPGRRALPKVLFRSLVEAGAVEPGTRLHCVDRRHVATVRADGTLSTAKGDLSIHRAGAMAMDAKSCNGWTFWHYESAGRLVPIDALRAVAREGMAA